MRRAACAVLACAALGAAGCGADYPDLMLVTRTGELPGARLTLLVNDGGTVRCDDGPEHRLPEPLLLEVREIATNLELDAAEDLVLPRSSDALLRFRVSMEQGSVTFSDTDAADRPVLGRLVAFTRTVAQDICGLVR